ncbi:MAG: hypothetical protein DMF79_16350 [Acidobacteria bacterium]|nr:MAG: hypothetical protein DMF79_16350 [Acidobacteriota bacterium]
MRTASARLTVAAPSAGPVASSSGSTASGTSRAGSSAGDGALGGSWARETAATDESQRLMAKGTPRRISTHRSE